MRFWYDTEFLEDGRTIDLVSIGVVAEDGREYYAVSTEFDPARAVPWVREHVLPQLPPQADPEWRPRERIKADLLDFLGPDPELWAWIGPYDHLVLVQLWGDMTALPRHLPRYTREVKQLWEHLGRPPLPPQPGGNHHALDDARHVKVRWDTMAERAYLLGLAL
jgi:hypothetical protein